MAFAAPSEGELQVNMLYVPSMCQMPRVESPATQQPVRASHTPYAGVGPVYPVYMA